MLMSQQCSFHFFSFDGKNQKAILVENCTMLPLHFQKCYCDKLRIKKKRYQNRNVIRKMSLAGKTKPVSHVRLEMNSKQYLI